MELVTHSGVIPERIWRGTWRYIVAVNGCFDLLHAGHISLLERARRLGTWLVVGLNSDNSVRRYKGPGRPIIPAQERMQMLLALRSVDAVAIFEEDSAGQFLKWLEPSVWVRGEGGNTGEREIVESYGGRLEVVGRPEGLSTTKIIKRVQASLTVRLDRMADLTSPSSSAPA